MGVSQTAGCSNSQTSSPTTITASVSSAPSIAPTSTPSNEPTTGGEPTGLTSAPSNVPTNSPTPETSTVMPTSFPTTSQPTQAPILLTSAPTKAPQTQTTLQPTQELVINTENRCGPSELHARETCGTVCQSQADCAAGEYCWGVHPNYCGSIPKRVYTNPVQSTVCARCGKSELDARTFCGEPCTWECAGEGEVCLGVNSNYCDSEYDEEYSIFN